MDANTVANINTALTNAGNSVLDNFVAILPSIGVVIAIAFVIYLVLKTLTKLRKGK